MKKIRISRLEKLIYLSALIMIVITPFVSVFGQATISKTNIEVERLQKEINCQKNTVDSLSMKVNELASFDKINEVAEDMGLTYNNGNIKNINK